MKSQKNGTKEKTQKTKILSMSYNNYIPLKYKIFYLVHGGGEIDA